VIDDFLRESEEELFPTRQACLEWARAHYAGLVDGTLGGNLLSKYSMLGRFYTTQASLEFLERSIESALAERGLAYERAELATVFAYLRAVVLHVPFARTASERASWTTRYDVEAWAEQGYRKPLADYAFAEPRTFQAEAAPDKRALILAKVATFGEHPSGLGKFTRTMFARDLRRTFARERAEGRAVATA
jgi:hypothetical protein